MARVTGSTISLTGGSTYLLREGGTATIRVVSGAGYPWNADEVAKTRLTVWSANGNAFVPDGGASIVRVTPNIPAAANGPYQDGPEFRTVVVYDSQPAADSYWTWDVPIAGRDGCYGDEQLFVKVELLASNDMVVADNSYDINGVKVYPHFNFRLTGAAGNGESAGVPFNMRVKAAGNTSVQIIWNTPIPATVTDIYRSTTRDGAQTSVTTAGPVGTNASYTNTGLTAGTTYYYFLRCRNDWGTSETVYAGSAKTMATPTAPDAPTITSVLTPTHDSVVVTFTPSDEKLMADGRGFRNLYTLYVRETADPDVEGSYSTRQVDGDADTVTMTGLTAETAYTLYMKVTNDGGQSSSTGTETATTPADPGLPGTPSNLTVTTQNYTSQVVTWEMTNPNESGFGLYYSTDETTWTAAQDTALAAGTRSFTKTGLAAATLYYWRLFSFNYYNGTLTTSTVATDSAATDAVPAQPSAPTITGAFAPTNSQVFITWAEGVTQTQTGFKVLRATSSGGTFSTVGNVGADTFHFYDVGLTAGTTYYYKIAAVGYAGDVNSTEANATTKENSNQIWPVSGFTLHNDSRTRVKEIAGRAIITSDLDRWVVRTGTNWYKAGLRPVRGPVGLAKTSGGALENGTYWVYLVLARGETRSIPSEPSAEVTISDTVRTLVVTPPLNGAGTKVSCRDWGYDQNGNVIDGADAWEIYLAEENEGEAYRIARLPLAKADWEDTPGSGTYTIDDALEKLDIFGGTRRPMEKLGESSLPPSCREAEVKDNRIVCTGETDIVPTAAEITAGAELQITNGNDYFTVTDWDATDACVYHRLILDDIDTGWEVYDYDYDAVQTTKVKKCYIRNSDPVINEGGFDGLTGNYTDFKLAGNPNRVYFSAFFSGEALNALTFSPETFPPLTVFENEFAPEDNTSPKGLVAVGGSLLMGKDEKWISVTGGDEPDFPLIQARILSRGSGLNAPLSMARDANDVVYYLGDTGPFRVTQGGVEKINFRFGNARMFGEIFDPSSITNAKGEWFSREDWYVVVGLNRVGRTGNRDGFILDVKNSALLPFSTPYEITHIKEYKSSAGEFQLMFGAEFGRLGYLFKRGLYVDGADYTLGYPMQQAAEIECQMVTGVVDTEEALTPRSAQPRVKCYPAEADFDFVLEVGGEIRNGDDPTEFTPVDEIHFGAEDTGSKVSFASGRYQQLQYRLRVKTLRDNPKATFAIKEIPLEVVVRHAS